MGCGSSKIGSVIDVQHQPGSLKDINKETKSITVQQCPVQEKNNKNISKTHFEEVDGVEKNKENGKLENLEHYSSLTNLSAQESSESFKFKKGKLFQSLRIFEEADKRALEAPSLLTSSGKKLAEYLIEPFSSSGLLKVRVLWRWITHNISYDVDSYFNPAERRCSKVDSSTILSTGKAVCSGYANTLKTLAEYAGLKMERITGWSKGYSYIMGTSFAEKDTNHAWSAVYLNGFWWLLDATWGAGHVDENKNFNREYTEHYFLTDPDQFIYDHYPEDDTWQLLSEPISMEMYENLAKFSKYFFQLKMKPVTHVNSIINCEKKIHMKFKIEKEIPVKCTGTMSSELWSEDTDQYLHIYTTDKILHVLVNMPHQGKFTLKLFAQLASDEDQSLPMICSYIINCTKKQDNCTTYPKQYKKWSPGFYLHSPTQGQLIVGETYKFKIALPGVIEMAVCLGGKKSSWLRIPNTTETLWEGDVTMDAGTERVNVVAKFDNQNSTTFSSLLEYQVIKTSLKCSLLYECDKKE